MITVGIFVAFGSWATDLLSCEDETPMPWVTPPDVRRDDWTVCNLLTACGVKAVPLSECRGWMKLPVCKPDALRKMADDFEAFPAATSVEQCAALATYPGRKDNPCVRW